MKRISSLLTSFSMPAVSLALLIPLLTGCEGASTTTESSSEGGSSSDFSSSHASAEHSSSTSSSTGSDTQDIAGSWLLTKIIKETDGEEIIYTPYYLDIDNHGKLDFESPCFTTEYQWNPRTNGFDQTEKIEEYACEDSAQSLELARQIATAHTTSGSKYQNLRMIGDDYTLVFEQYKPTCTSPLSWPDDANFTPTVQLVFTSSPIANLKLKPFVLNHDDFKILSWEQSCTPENEEIVNAELNLKTLNQLRCLHGVNAFTFNTNTEGQP